MSWSREPCIGRSSAQPGSRGRQEPARTDRLSLIIQVRPELHVESADDAFRSRAEAIRAEDLVAALDELGIGTVRPAIRSIPPERIRELEGEARENGFELRWSLNAFWEAPVPDVSELRARDELIRRLLTFDVIVSVQWDEPLRLAGDPGLPDESDKQDHLDPAGAGIDAWAAWAGAGVDGSGVNGHQVRFVDIERDWRLDHPDLPPSTTVVDGPGSGDSVDQLHGTQVLGLVAAQDNGVGVLGVAKGMSEVLLFPAQGNNAHANAMAKAIATLAPGDIILVENEGPTGSIYEDNLPIAYAAISLASGTGRVVVEPAGNGNINLDIPDGVDGVKLYGDSGAIVVGASDPSSGHDRWAESSRGSNYGERVDVFASGVTTWTTGFNADGSPVSHNAFGHTSAATAIVAGVAVLVQEMAIKVHGAPFPPTKLRDVLKIGGTLQGTGRPGNIGVMPNLDEIWKYVSAGQPDLFVRDNPADPGDIPSAGGISASPDILVRNVSTVPAADATSVPVDPAAGDHYVFVRVSNRTTGAPTNVQAKVYWSEPATLIKPEDWQDASHLIGTADSGATAVTPAAPVWIGPITWPASKIPTPGHYCFIAIVQHPDDPAPVVPNFESAAGQLGLSAVDLFREFVRTNNNVAWRNFNVVGAPSASEALGGTTFYVRGDAARPRVYDLEILQTDVPPAATLVLEVEQDLLRGRCPAPSVDRWVDGKGSVRYALPPDGPVLLRGVVLPPGARYAARFVAVEGWPDGSVCESTVALRQLLGGREVGRVTFAVRPRASGRET